MLIKPPSEILSSEITPESVYRNRRTFLRTAAVVTAGTAAAFALPRFTGPQDPPYKRPTAGPFNTDEDLTSYKDITTYNNFYEFGTDKDDPSEYAGSLKIRPWKVRWAEIASEAPRSETQATG